MSMKIAVIGCGDIAHAAHGPALRKYADEHDDVELAACADLSSERLQSFKEAFGFTQGFSNYQTMLEQVKPDAVSILVPVHLASQVAVDVMERGFPIFLEKPPGLTREETLAIVNTAERLGQKNAVAFNRRHMPLICRLKEMTEATAQAIHCEFTRFNRLDADFSTTAIHGIDAVSFLAGADYQSVEFFYQPLPQYGPNVINTVLNARFTNGICATLAFYPVTGAVTERYTVYAKDSMYRLCTPVWGGIDYKNGYDFPGNLEHVSADRQVFFCTGKDLPDGETGFEANGFYAENKAFYEAIRSGGIPSDPVISGLQAVEISCAMRAGKPSIQFA